MGIIISAILASIFILFIVSHNDKYEILCIFIGMWAGICILATLQLYGMQDYNNYAFVVILVGCLAYVMGYMLSCKVRIGIRNVTKIENNEAGDISQINTTILRLLVIVSLIYYVVLFLQMVRELSSGTTYYMFRRMYQGYEESSLYTSAVQQYIGSYISVPTIFVLEAIAVMWTFQKKYKEYKTLYFSIIITIVLYIITSASRIAILTIIVETLFCLRIYKVSISKKTKRNIRRMIILLIVAILVITFYRQSTVGVFQDDWGIDASTYAYFSVSVPILGHWIEVAQEESWLTFGMSFIRVPASLIHLIFLNRIGIANSTLLDNTISYINATDEFLQVFDLHTYNNFATMFYYFYLDAREFGVVVGSFFWGYICGRTNIRMLNSQGENEILMLLLIIAGVIKCMAYWPLSTPNYFMAIVYAVLLSGRVRIKGLRDTGRRV